MAKVNDAVTFQNVSFWREKNLIYDRVSFGIPWGKITAILGPSGTGKTTLLHLIGRLLTPQNGDICVLGKKLNSLSKHDLLSLRKKMGVLFQSSALFTQMSVFDNIAFPLRQNTQLPEHIIYNLVLMKLEAVGLRGTLKMMPSELSGGMARRVALARAIALDPSLILYDEPFAGQDPISLNVILSLIKRLNDALGMTSIIVSHDINEVLSIADYVIIVANRKIAIAGSADEVKNSDDAFIQQFLQGRINGPIAFDYPAETFTSMLNQQQLA